MFLIKTPSVLIQLGIVALLIGASKGTLAQSRFSMSVEASPLNEFFRYKSTSSQFEPMNMAGFRAGTSLHAQLAPRWSVSSGLWLEWKSTRNVNYGSLTNLAHHTIKVPLLVHYQLTDKRLTPYFSAGLLLEKLMYFQYSNPKPSEDIVLIDLAIEPQLKYLLGAGPGTDSTSTWRVSSSLLSCLVHGQANKRIN